MKEAGGAFRLPGVDREENLWSRTHQEREVPVKPPVLGKPLAKPVENKVTPKRKLGKLPVRESQSIRTRMLSLLE